jgi:hypothetical protein
MISPEMTDAEVAAQIERADRFIVDFREMVAATVVDPRSPCADAHRRGRAAVRLFPREQREPANKALS